MGAWGAGSFENDAAMDFAASITAPQDLLRPLIIRTPEDFIGADLGCQIVVVSECVAAMRGHPHPDIPADLLARLAEFGKPGKSLYHHTRDHLAGVMSRGELMELWAEDAPSDWNAAMHDLLARLNRKQGEKLQNEPEPERDFNHAECLLCDTQLGLEDSVVLEATVENGAAKGRGFAGWVHLQCFNRALHPKYTIRHYSMHDEDMPDDLGAMLEEPPNLEE